MINEVRDLLERVTTPGDLAVILIVAAGGFLADAGLDVVGFLEPGIFGVTAAAGALGVKKAVDAARQNRSSAREQAADERAVTERAERLLNLLPPSMPKPVVSRLRIEMRLHREDITSVTRLERVIKEVVEELREHWNDQERGELGGVPEMSGEGSADRLG